LNIRYIYDNGKIKVYNENGDTKTLDYSDNIDEILITENIIEQMELEYQSLNEQLSKYRGNISFKRLSKSIFILSSIPIMLICLPFTLGILNFSEVSLLGFVGAIGIPSILSMYLIFEYKNNKNTKNAIETQIEFLKQNLSLELQKLNRLKKEKTKENEIVQLPISKRVDDIGELRRLRKLLLLFHNYGYYSKDHNKYIEKESLSKTIKKKSKF